MLSICKACAVLLSWASDNQVAMLSSVHAVASYLSTKHRQALLLLLLL
jgi:hypothetical protein